MDATVVITPFPMEFFANLGSGPHIYSYELVDINSMILQWMNGQHKKVEKGEGVEVSNYKDISGG
jgi:hypothetical protein